MWFGAKGTFSSAHPAMHLVQLLLPLTDNDGQRFPESQFVAVRDELTERFGGMTAYSRSPAEGLWEEGGEGKAHDDIVVHEVMVEQLDRGWWRTFRERLERDFRQDEIVIRAQAAERL